MCVYNAIQSSHNICSEQIERLPLAVTLRYIICHTQTHTHFLRHFISALIISSNSFRLYMRCSHAFGRLIFFIRSIPETYTIFSGTTLDINIVVLFIYVFTFRPRDILNLHSVCTRSSYNVYIMFMFEKLYIYSSVIMHHSFAIYTVYALYVLCYIQSCKLNRFFSFIYCKSSKAAKFYRVVIACVQRESVFSIRVIRLRSAYYLNLHICIRNKFLQRRPYFRENKKKIY